MDNKERLIIFLIGVAKVFNNFTTVDVTDQYINETIEDLLEKFSDKNINVALSSLEQLDAIVIMLIHKISGNENEPLWSIINSNNKYFLIPSEDAIQKYSIQLPSEDGIFLYSDFEIPPPPQPPPKNPFFRFLQGGKKSKRRRRTKSTFYTFKKSYAKRTAKQRAKQRTK